MTTEIVIKLISFVLATIFIVSLFKLFIAIDEGDKVKHKKYLRIFVVALCLLIGLVISTNLITIDFHIK